MKNTLKENMQRFGTKNLAEQGAPQPDILTALNAYKEIFNAALQRIESANLDLNVEEDVLKLNAQTVLESYTKYIDNTIKTWNAYKDQYSLQAIIEDGAGIIKQHIDDNLIY